MSVDRLRRLILTLLFALAACGRPPSSAEPRPDGSVAAPAPAPELPVAEAPLDRAALLGDVARAASAFAAGAGDGDLQKGLDGKRFVLRSRFGCPADRSGSDRWSVSFDPARRILRIRVNPATPGPDFAIDRLGTGKVEAAEGFAIERWWMLDPGCPRRAPATLAEAPTNADSGHSLAGVAAPTATPSALAGTAAPSRAMLIAQFFTAEDPRTGRHDGRAYEATVKLAEGEAPGAAGYDLVIAGRLRAIPDGPVIACIGSNPDLPPSCAISAIFDKVAITDAATGRTIAEWTSS